MVNPGIMLLALKVQGFLQGGAILELVGVRAY